MTFAIHEGTRRTPFLSTKRHEGALRTPFCPRRTRRDAENCFFYPRRDMTKNTEGVADFLCAAVRFCEDQSHFAPANHFSDKGQQALNFSRLSLFSATAERRRHRVRFKMGGGSFRLPLSHCTGCGRDARVPSEAIPQVWRTPAFKNPLTPRCRRVKIIAGWLTGFAPGRRRTKEPVMKVPDAVIPHDSRLRSGTTVEGGAQEDGYGGMAPYSFLSLNLLPYNPLTCLKGWCSYRSFREHSVPMRGNRR